MRLHSAVDWMIPLTAAFLLGLLICELQFEPLMAWVTRVNEGFNEAAWFDTLATWVEGLRA